MLNRNERSLFPADYTTVDLRPETLLEALMSEGPTTARMVSTEEVRPLLDVIGYATELLTDEHAFIINAITFEGVRFEDLGERLGVSRTHAWRLHNQAMARLRYLLLNYKPVRERLGMEPTWQSEAMNELIYIAGNVWDDPIDTDDKAPHFIAEIASNVDQAIAEFDMGLELRAVRALTSAGMVAADYLRSVNMWSLGAMHQLLVSKQVDYGHGNILKFGMQGVLVRASDKVERLKNLSGSGVRPRNESLIDSFRDIIGYAVIARMLKAETFELELSEEETIEWVDSLGEAA